MRDCIFFFMYLCRKMCKYGTEWNWRKKEWLTHACIPFAFPTDALLLHSIYVIIYSHSTDLIACLLHFCVYIHAHTHKRNANEHTLARSNPWTHIQPSHSIKERPQYRLVRAKQSFYLCSANTQTPMSLSCVGCERGIHIVVYSEQIRCEYLK